MNYSKPWADAFSDGKVTEARYYDAGDTVTVEFVGTGTHDGPLGPMPATGWFLPIGLAVASPVYSAAIMIGWVFADNVMVIVFGAPSA